MIRAGFCVDRVVGARDRASRPRRSRSAPAGMIQVSDRDDDDQDEQDRVGRREREAALLLGRARCRRPSSPVMPCSSSFGRADRRGADCPVGRLGRPVAPDPSMRSMLEPGEPVDQRDDRAQQVEEAERQVRRWWRTPSTPAMYAPQLFQGTSGEVTVPASSTVRDSIRGAMPRCAEREPVDAAGHDDGDVLVAGDDVQPDRRER